MTNREKRQLYRQLERLRDYFKEKGRREEGRVPLVCSDYALIQLVELCPKTLEDLNKVPEIGEQFVKKYGEEFIEIIREHSMDDTERDVEMTPEQEQILKELEKKLTSINSRNRLLYFSRLTNKTGGDLSSVFDQESIEAFLMGRGKLTVFNDINNQEEEALYRRCRGVSREASKEFREKGQNNLYIGYPFVKGRLTGENFDVRAPLVLFPIVADATPEKIVFSIDDSRDIQYNTALVLANYKFNGVKDPLPDVAIEGLEQDDFIDDALSFYEENHISIECDVDSELVAFEEYKRDTFPSFRNGELNLEYCAVLGRYPVCDNAIQKDFDSILENKTINHLLESLLEGVVEIETIDDSYSGEFEQPVDERDLVISERDLNYINDLNSSQEAVIKAANSFDSLVVQGPPGTGKSQTIASLIADAAIQGKTVLMVSEKKTALDVVYSRLGNLSSYALLIDDVTNKSLFYKQLDQMLNHGSASKGQSDSLGTIITDIDNDIKDLETVANALFAANERIGTEPYKLYLENDKIDFDNLEEREIAKKLGEHTQELVEWNYPRIHRCYESFSRGDKLESCLNVVRITECFPLVKYVKDLSTIDCYSMIDDAEQAVEAVKEWSAKGFFARLMSKRSLNDSVVIPFINKYLASISTSSFKWFTDNIGKLSEVSKQYSVYQSDKPIYDSLDQDELSYVKAVYETSLELGYDSNIVNQKVYNYVLFTFIDLFQNENGELLHTIYNFDSVVRELSELINKRKQITRTQLAEVLQRSIGGMVSSKRGRDIRRSVESRRRMSINKFVDRYSFELFRYVKIWLLTPEVVSEIIPLQNGVFDLVVFDEASQMYVEKGLPSILRAKRVVVAGDSKQLRPSSLGSGRLEISEEEFPEDEDIPASLEEESLLDLAKAKYRDVLLNYHYRSKYEELIAFSNYAFYRAGLYVSPNVREPKNPPIEVLKIDNGLWTKRANVPEAKEVVELLKRVFSERKNNETIGIITFNVSQRDMIDDLIDEECAVDPGFAAQIRNELNRTKDGQDIGLFVKNIESVQGDERDIIIFSVGYAKNESGRIFRNFGWLNQKGGENRLNVAVSRAKKKVYIVTSITPEELQVEDAKNNGPRYLKKYLEYAFAVSNHDKETARNVLLSFSDQANLGEYVSFDSVFEEQVYDALVAEGYDVDTQVGIGGYSIDLAIKYEGNYVLGVECDGKLYHSSKSARERDYHRQKYLESRGWTIYRIWSPNWWKDPKNEIARISTIVNSRIEENKARIDKTIEKPALKRSNIESEEIRSIVEEMQDSTTGRGKKTPAKKEYARGAEKEKKTPSDIITKQPKKPSKHAVARNPKEYKSKASNSETRIVTRGQKKNTEHIERVKQNPLSPVEDSQAKRKCENCKYYRNEECAGLKICDLYTQVPGAE